MDDIRLMIVDDESAVRQGLTRLFQAFRGIEVCGEASTAREAGAVAGAVRPDVALVDLRLGVDSGVDASAKIKAESPGTAILLITAASPEQASEAVASAGATGYVLKQLRAADLVGAVRSAAAAPKD